MKSWSNDARKKLKTIIIAMNANKTKPKERVDAELFVIKVKKNNKIIIKTIIFRLLDFRKELKWTFAKHLILTILNKMQCFYENMHFCQFLVYFSSVRCIFQH